MLMKKFNFIKKSDSKVIGEKGETNENYNKWPALSKEEYDHSHLKKKT